VLHVGKKSVAPLLFCKVNNNFFVRPATASSIHGKLYGIYREKNTMSMDGLGIRQL
jgi:hypothetical protein